MDVIIEALVILIVLALVTLAIMEPPVNARHAQIMAVRPGVRVTAMELAIVPQIIVDHWTVLVKLA